MNAPGERSELSGRVALLTGAAGYLGSVMAAGLARAGAHVWLNGRREEPLRELAQQLRAQGGLADALPFDVTDAAAAREAISRLRAQHGRLDVLVHNAYSGGAGTLAHSSDAAFESAYAVTVVAASRLAREAQDLLEAAARQTRGGASIIHIASMYGMVSPDVRVYDSPAQANPPHYGAAKGGMLQLTRYLACELAPCRIRVNAISPGPFPSDRTRQTQPGLCARLAQKLPMARMGEPDELVGPLLFLASDAASFVTGHNLVVDGGWTAW